MAITFQNGLKRTTSYEEIGLVLQSLEDNYKVYQHHLTAIAGSAYNRFLDLKRDYYSKNIDLGTYRDFLRIIKAGLEEKNRYPEALHFEEMDEEIKKHNII